jgi:hypothetical protein
MTAEQARTMHVLTMWFLASMVVLAIASAVRAVMLRKARQAAHLDTLWANTCREYLREQRAGRFGDAVEVYIAMYDASENGWADFPQLAEVTRLFDCWKRG